MALRLDSDIYERLKRVADAEGRDLGDILSEACEANLGVLADIMEYVNEHLLDDPKGVERRVNRYMARLKRAVLDELAMMRLGAMLREAEKDEGDKAKGS